MTRRTAPAPSKARLPLALAAALGLGLTVATPAARADFVVAVSSATVLPGSTGNGLEVTLTNTGPSAATIGSFTFELTSSAPAVISFTGATTATAAPYLFAGHSLFGPTISTTTGTTLFASDLYDVPGAGATVAAGASVGLGLVRFNMGNVAGTFNVSLTGFPGTTLGDPNGADIPINRLAGGTIQVVPEPASLTLLGLGAAAVLAVSPRLRRRA